LKTKSFYSFWFALLLSGLMINADGLTSYSGGAKASASSFHFANKTTPKDICKTNTYWNKRFLQTTGFLLFIRI
jgi:hypothetical protein